MTAKLSVHKKYMDIATMKLIAIHQRGTKRDFVDLYFILKSVPFHQIASSAIHRFGKERINPFQIGKSLVYFSDADSDPDPHYKNNNHIKWEIIKDFFRQHIKQFVWDLENNKKALELFRKTSGKSTWKGFTPFREK